MSKILLVDDEPDLVELLKARLEVNNYAVITANSGTVCLQKARTENIDVILLDLVMPDMDGYETCRRLKEMAEVKNVPIILFTAFYASNVKEKTKKLGAFDYIVKPFEPKQLLERIERALKKKE